MQPSIATTPPKKPAPLPESLQAEMRLTMQQVMALVGMGRTKVYTEIKAGRLPKPVLRSPRCTRWRAGDVVDFLNRGAA